MLCLIKCENIFGRFYRDLYTIEYQKRDLSHIYFLIFFNSVNEFLEVFHINKVIYTELPIIEINLTGELIKIMTSVILHDLYRKIDHNLPCIINSQDSPLRCKNIILAIFMKKLLFKKTVTYFIDNAITVLFTKFHILKIKIRNLNLITTK